MSRIPPHPPLPPKGLEGRLFTYILRWILFILVMCICTCVWETRIPCFRSQALVSMRRVEASTRGSKIPQRLLSTSREALRPPTPAPRAPRDFPQLSPGPTPLRSRRLHGLKAEMMPFRKLVGFETHDSRHRPNLNRSLSIRTTLGRPTGRRASRRARRCARDARSPRRL